MSEITLYDITGNRLYLNAEERTMFLAEAQKRAAHIRTFCETLVYSGCRISEALELTPKSIDLGSNAIIVRSLKKRREGVYRIIPMPSGYLDTLNIAHDIREAQKRPKTANVPLWSWSRQHASTYIIKPIMIDSGISEGKHQTAKGIRHSYGINAIVKGVPLNMLQKWLGHANIKTTAVYANAIGEAEQDLANRMWD
ncbi:MAG: integrase [Bacteroidetes bacterium]|nr:MAG: integrase [Bacteroidota bacterium]